jgi:hypothetical protein
VTRLAPGRSSSVLAGALVPAQASVGSGGGTKAWGCGSLGSVIAQVYAPARTEVRALQGRWRNGHQRPVLKHGPRSRGSARVFGCQTRTRNESERRWELRRTTDRS